MAGPWEQYQGQQAQASPQDGPWSQYAAPPTATAPARQPQAQPRQTPAQAPGLQDQMEAAGLPSDEAEYFARNDAFEGGLGDPGSSERNPISLYGDTSQIQNGQWVIDETGTVYPWTGDSGEVEITAGQTPDSPGYLAAVERERALYGDQPGQRQIDFTSQATAPINDEMGWLAGYGSQGFENLIRRLHGQDIEIGAMEAANAARDVSNEMQSAYQDENPLKSAAGNILGGFAFAPGRAASAVGGATQFLRPTMAQGYGQAAGVGGLYGTAEADGGVGDRALGGLLGAGAGVATAGLLDAGLGLGSRIARNLSDPVNSESRRVGGVLRRALRADKVEPSDYLSRLATLPDGGLPFEAAGPNLQAITEVMAQTPGPARTRITGALDARRATTPDRFRQRVQDDLGGQGDYFATLDRSIEGRRDAAKTVMEEIGDQLVTLDQNSIQALRSERSAGAIRDAAANALTSADEAVRNSGADLNRLADRLLDDPSGVTITLRQAQDISRALLDAGNSAFRGGDGARGTALSGLGRAVRENARTPERGGFAEYDQWLRRYGDESSQIEALETGRRIFRNADDPSADGMSAEVLRREFNDMSETAQDMFRKGVGEAIVGRARTSRGDIGAMRDLMRSDEFADRIRIAFPKEAAFSRFMTSVGDEVNMANASNTILGNSRTDFRRNAARWVGDPGFEQAGSELSQVTITGLPLEIGRRGVRAAGRALGRRNSVAQNEVANDLAGEALTDDEAMRRILHTLLRRQPLLSGRAPGGVAASTGNEVHQGTRGLLRPR